MATNYIGLPGDQEIMKRTWAEKFDRHYGKTADARSIYLAHPDQFLRFAKVFPRPAYLLEQLQASYEELGATLDLFNAEYVARPRGRGLLGGPSPILGGNSKVQVANDPFEYFAARFNYNSFFLHLRAALKSCSRSVEPLLYEIAQDIVDIFDDADRQAIVAELMSSEIATRLMQKVQHTNTFGIWAVRSTLAREEASFARNVAHIRPRLGRGPVVDLAAAPSACELGSNDMARGDDDAGRDDMLESAVDDWTFTTFASNDDELSSKNRGSLPTRPRVSFEEDLTLEGMTP